MTKKTAEDAFMDHRKAIYDKIGRLAVKVETARTEFEHEGHKNWGYVGDLEYIDSLLKRALGEEE